MDKQPSVFIAHSSLDQQYARIVRNQFEAREHESLLLHLEQQMTTNFLKKLLQREIQARDWVVVVTSPNSQKSKWVSFETAYANLHEKPVFHIELDQCSGLQGQLLVNCIDKQVARISRKIRVFMSYARKDLTLAENISRDLRKRGYQVWIDREQLEPGSNWMQSINDAIRETCEKGYIIVLVSEYSLNKPYIRSEIDLALKLRGRIIPCVVESVDFFALPSLSQIQHLNFGNQPYKEAFQQLIHALR